MNKQAFLDKLERLAAALPDVDREKLVEYYSEMIDDRVEEGIPEEEAVSMLGDPSDLARELGGGATQQAVPKSGTACESVPALNGLRIRVANADVGLLREALENGAAAQLRFSDPERFTWRVDGDVMEIIEREPEGARFSLRRVVELLTSPSPRFTVALAGDLAGALEYTSAGGDFEAKGVGFGTARLHSASGNIELKALSCNAALEIDAKSGDVRLDVVSAGEARVKTASGDITATDLTTAGELRLEAASGDIELRNARGDSLSLSTHSGDIEVDRGTAGAANIHSASGDVRLEELETDPTLAVETASGDIDLRRCIARQTQLKTTSGDVTVRLEPLPNGYDISTNTVSGSIEFDDGAPEGTEGPQPRITVNTVSGDIDIQPVR